MAKTAGVPWRTVEEGPAGQSRNSFFHLAGLRSRIPPNSPTPGAALRRLVDRAGRQAIVRAVRGNLGHFAVPETPDPSLVELVEEPFESVADVTDRLARLESRLRDRDDRRAVFLTSYVTMTR